MTSSHSRHQDDRGRYGSSSRGQYGSHRGREYDRSSYSNDSRRSRDEHSYSRGYPPTTQRPGYTYNDHHPVQPPASSRYLEDGEIMLNYSDAPGSVLPTGPRHFSPPRSIASSNAHTRQDVQPADTARGASQAQKGTIKEDVPTADLTPINLEPAEEPDPEQVLAERRRKRAEILAKYAAKPPTPAANDSNNSSAQPDLATSRQRGGEEEDTVSADSIDRGDHGRDQLERAAKRPKLGTESPSMSASATTSTTAEPSRAASVDPAHSKFVLLKEEGNETASDSRTDPNRDRLNVHVSEVTGEDEPEISAADYNPDFDRREDEKRMERLAAANGRTAGSGGTAGVIAANAEDAGRTSSDEEGGEEGDEEDEEDDMFAIGLEDTKAKKKKRKAAKSGAVPVVNRANDAAAMNPSLLADNFDDSEGYYKVILGEVLEGGRYLVQANLGKGMFSSVVKAKDLGEDGKGIYKAEDGDRREVAIKMVRSQESMFKAGLKEAQILRKLMEADPDDKKHLIRLLRTFEHRGHLCLVFESLSMNLREVVKRYGKDIGLNLRAVRAYASQMFLALALMKKCELMHADLKPDNILVNESKSTLKVCDLGSASDVTENEITPYLVSRFYRAPEIILGLPYDCSLDVWSIGCTLYELYTGKILFPGRTNNHMLLLMMETKGKFQNKLVKKARFGDQHFDENMNFLSHEKNDVITPRQIPSKPPSDLRSRLMPPGVTRKMKDEEVRLLTNFVDLLDKMLSLEPSKRPLPKDLLAHPFIRG